MTLISLLKWLLILYSVLPFDDGRIMMYSKA